MISWAQRSVGLARADGNPLPAARSLFTVVAPLVEAGRGHGAVELFFFQRKAPDVRLRVGAEALDDGWLAELDAALEALVADGVLTQRFAAPYEPEVRKFGGPAAADACHSHFDADTRLWLATQRLGSADGPLAEPSPYDLAVSAADDLFVRVLRDRDEVWDTWANLADIVGDPDPGVAPPTRLALDDPAGPLAAERAALLAGHDAFAQAIEAELEAGALRVGPRAILPFVAQLDLQRWGLGGPQQAAAASAMAAAWDPTRELRGR